MKTTSTAHAKRSPLGEILLAQGRITQAELDAALAYKEERGVKLGQALVALHLVTQSVLAQALKAQGKFHCIELTPEIIDPNVAALLGPEISQRMLAVAVNRIAGIVTVAMEDPSESYNVDAISMHLGAPVLAVHADPERIERCINRLFPTFEQTLVSDAGTFAAPEYVPNPIDLTIAAEQEGDADTRAGSLVDAVLEEALIAGATDVHFEPNSEVLCVRFRIDGLLRERMQLPTAIAGPVLARLRSLARFELHNVGGSEVRVVECEVNSRRMWLSVAIAPCLYGETAVLRLREIGRRPVAVGDLGLSMQARADLERMTSRSSGLVLFAGPPRSGRTTTLYSILDEMARTCCSGRKLVVIDRSAAFHLQGSVQIPLPGVPEHTSNAGVPAAVRAALQHEPDVLVVGRVEDSETAHVLLRAALEGRLVISTIAAVDSAEAILRLIDLGPDRRTVAAALQGVLAQGLVHRICTHCRREAEPAHDTLMRRADDGPFFEGAGCERCDQSGYRGTLALFEMLRMDDELASLLRSGAGSDELRAAAVARGMTRFVGDGMRKALAGETTLAELRRRASTRE